MHLFSVWLLSAGDFLKLKKNPESRQIYQDSNLVEVQDESYILERG